MMFRRSKKILRHEIDPGEVMLDTKNIPGFNTQQFEGVIEKPISKFSIRVVLGLVVLAGLLFVGQLFKLQVGQGDMYFTKSENNRLEHTPIFAERGVIYDRKDVELAWNELPLPGELFPTRKYLGPGFAHLLGYVSYPTKDQKGYYWRTEIIGEQGAEKRLDALLQGKNGTKLVEVDALGNYTAENLMVPPEAGSNVHLTIDAGVQQSLHTAIQELAETANFQAGAGVIMNVKTGELLALTSYPEYDSSVLSFGTDRTTIASYNSDNRKPYLNRVVAGTFTPGSTMKPYLALGALEEGIITDDTTVMSTGKIEIPNRFNPDQPQTFRDWRPQGHGSTNVYHAIADSVNTFFYAIGGGLGGQEGLGITRMEKYIRMFGFGTKTGIDIEGEREGNIPNPAWKLKTFPSDGAWRLGDTYNSAIGQFGFLVTPIQLVHAVGGIATRGTLVAPRTMPGDGSMKTETISGISQENFNIMHQAMRETVTKGTAQSLNVPYVHAAAKTGTAQTGISNRSMNSWVTGFWPVENPQYAFVVVMENASSTNQMGASGTMRKVFDYIETNSPEYFEVE
ncbi:MAG: hypothetical protein KBC98_01275 [Candidatus Pacebacteria bacterium]|nr:hypothetical protein [Candidatus Paceibacterota bacterium]